MRQFFCLSLFVCLACYPERDPTDGDPVSPPNTAEDAGVVEEDLGQSPDAGNEIPAPSVDAGQQTEEPEPTVDAGSEETTDAGIQCEAGYAENAATGECEDVNECLSGNGSCVQTCLNTPGSFECGCYEGYALNADHVSCHDVDECETDNGGCEDVCSNILGSFECACNGSRYLNEDGLACQTHAETAQSIAESFNVGDISLVLDPDDIYEQGSLGDMNFVDAFYKALESFLTDGSDVESPIAWVSSSDGNANALPSYMNQHYTYIYLVPNRARLSPDSWYPPEYGESIEDHWVFFMTGDAEMGALFWAIVPRNGEPVYNYGFD
jgi:hypothetical protein